MAGLRALNRRWLEVLDRLDDQALDLEAPFPWPAGSGRSVAGTVAWVNVELTKNISELGQLHLLHAANR